MKKNKKIIYLFLMGVLISGALVFGLVRNVVLADDSGVVSQGVGGDEELTDLQKQIKKKQEEIKKIEDRIGEYDASIKAYRNQSVTLASQLAFLDAKINKTEAEIDLTENQIIENSLLIQDSENKIKQNKTEIEKNKKYLKNFIQERYKQDRKSDIEILLTNDNLSDFYNNLEVSSALQAKLSESLSGLKKAKQEMERKMTEYESQKKSLQNLKDKLGKNKDSLEEQKMLKQNVLVQTKNSEYRFQSLLSQAKAEQARASTDIASLEKKIRSRLNEEGSSLEDLGEADFVYPVVNRGITAYFHDPDYPYRYIFEHPAIDLRAYQGTTIKASGSGYVARVHFDGTTNYAYIMLVHSDGMSTVYGHISKPLVKEDQFVVQGQPIALSGGMPGTAGAGKLSTGPHLHFEVRKDGIPVNPLNYL
jgi:murein DD-endopeptidase MepM/ murein hydrolase activator NlpD